MEYAKKVPKPKVLPRQNSVDNAGGSVCDSTRPVAAAMSTVTSDTEFLHQLQRLQERHRAERQQVALLMQNNV